MSNLRNCMNKKNFVNGGNNKKKCLYKKALTGFVNVYMKKKKVSDLNKLIYTADNTTPHNNNYKQYC